MAADDDPQGVGPGRPDGSLGPWPEVPVPDDISELAADLAAYRAEQRAAARRVLRARRRARAHPLWRWTIPREKPIAPGFTGVSPHRLLLPLTMTGIALLLCAVVTVLLTMFAPNFQQTTRRSAPLANSAGIFPSDPHGLLPAVQLVAGDGSLRDVRGLRPAVLLMLPAGCSCQNQLERLVQDAGAQRLSAYAVADDRATFSQALDVAGLTAFRDPGGQLQQALGQPGSAPVAVIVDIDGRVLDRLSGPQLGTQLADRLQQLFAGR